MTTHIRLGGFNGFGAINTAQFNVTSRAQQINPGYVDSPGFPPTQPIVGSGGGGTIINPPSTRPTAVNLISSFINQTNQIQPTQTNIGPIVDYGCSDGSRVSDPSMCPAPASSSITTDPNHGGYEIPVDGSGNAYVPPPGPPGTITPGTITPAPPVMVVGLSPVGKFVLAGLGILAGIAGAAVVIHHHNQSGAVQR